MLALAEVMATLWCLLQGSLRGRFGRRRWESNNISQSTWSPRLLSRITQTAL